ncbi:unnamed protein product [Rangifer tarandus platyrhynchus]|uniref:Uncharacterized protein n=2 Tax=Rangifer tarandus platyrhynchus TaxID=3082113 RepID=A0ACB0F862_RANTA|nr:unnamed protein product [Rangifer tarandus platyrhynchus]CAI9708479.1 unnamed protein product [Rangifer tarandus platyrhynchus]
MRPRTGRETGDVRLGRQADQEQGWPRPSWALSHVPHPGGWVDEREADGLTMGPGQRDRQGLRAAGAALSMPPQGRTGPGNPPEEVPRHHQTLLGLQLGLRVAHTSASNGKWPLSAWADHAGEPHQAEPVSLLQAAV